MTSRRTVFLAAALALLVAGSDCGPRTPNDDNGESKKQSRYVVISPCEDLTKLRVLPFKRSMDHVDRLTFINLSNDEVTIKFLPSHPIQADGPPEFTLQPEEARVLQIKQDIPDGDYEYSVVAQNYQPSLPGPFIVLP